MSLDTETRLPVSGQRSMTRRTRDFVTLIIAVAVVFAALAFLGSIGVIEAVSAVVVVAAFAMAYHVGSSAIGPIGGSASRENASPSMAEPALAEILRALPMPAFAVDGSQRVVNFNSEADLLFRLEGRQPALVGSVVRSQPLIAGLERCLGGVNEETVEVELGDLPDEVWQAHLRRLEAAPLVLVILEDQTPLKRAARARADFLANASHELRTPLTALSGFIETLRGPARHDTGAWDRFLEIMARECDRMSRLISDLLSLSRIEAGQSVAPSDSEDLLALVTNATDALSHMAEDSNIQIGLKLPDDLPQVIAHGDELTQVIDNLLSNALKYSPPGGQITILCGTAPSPALARTLATSHWPESEHMTLVQSAYRSGLNEPTVWLRVEDEGPGIEREHLPRLGERFYRADQSRGGKISGTGLGLAIVKHIMAHHRGGLAVETRLGKGSAFTVWLPATRHALPASGQAIS